MRLPTKTEKFISLVISLSFYTHSTVTLFAEPCQAFSPEFIATMLMNQLSLRIISFV